MAHRINAGSILLKMYNEILSLTETSVIKPPAEYHEQVIAVKNVLKNDESGLVNTVLDFAIECASKVTYKVETDNDNLTEIYNTWLENINSSLRRKKVEVGVNGLSKQYYMEMLKGSSHALLRTLYSEKKVMSDGSKMMMPDLMWFVDGKDIYVDNEENNQVIGKEKYQLKIGKDNSEDDYISLPKMKNEEIFVQTPFDAWGTLYPIPFVIRRGIYKNMLALENISNQGESIVRKALKYLLIILKGNDSTFAEQGHYGREKLLEAKESFKKFLNDMDIEGGIPTLVTNYDTKIDHLIPDFTKVIKSELQDPSVRKILQGLGLIELLQGTGTASRREAIINPKPFIKLVNSLIDSYCTLLTDVLEVTREKNSVNIKYNAVKIKVKATPVVEFIDTDEKELFRSIFDRGVVDYESLCEILGLDYNGVVARSKKQLENGIDAILYPHIIMNQEAQVSELESKRYLKKPKDNPTPDYRDDRNGSGRQNFIQAARVFEGAPYQRLSELPKHIKKLPIELQRIWKSTFNKKYMKTGSEAEAFRLAYALINKIKRQRLKNRSK